MRAEGIAHETEATKGRGQHHRIKGGPPTPRLRRRIVRHLYCQVTWKNGAAVATRPRGYRCAGSPAGDVL